MYLVLFVITVVSPVNVLYLMILFCPVPTYNPPPPSGVDFVDITVLYSKIPDLSISEEPPIEVQMTANLYPDAPLSKML